MRTMLPRVGAFKTHLTLMILVGLWLTITEYAMEVHFVVTVAVVAALVLISGLVTAARVNRLAKHCERELQIARHAARKTKDELHLVITTLPALRAMYDQLCPLMAPTNYVMYEFGRWLDWALNPRHTNVKEWLQTCIKSKGAALPELHGVCDHLDTEANRKAAKHAVTQVAYAAYMDIEFLRSSQVHPDEGSGSEQNPVPPQSEKRLTSA